MTADERLAIGHFDCPLCGATEEEDCIAVAIGNDIQTGIRFVALRVSESHSYAERPHPERVALVASLSAVDRLALLNG